MTDRPFRIVFAIYDSMTHLDFTGPHQFMCRIPQSETLVASIDGGTVEAEGLHFANTVPLRDIDVCDLICVPGGRALALIENADFLAQLRRLAGTARYITSVCTGSLLLGAAGLLKGKRAACHWAWRDLLIEFGAVPVAERVVRDGNLITGGGVTAGIDFALTVIAEVAGPEVAQRLQLGFEYDPQPPFDSGSPQTAPTEVLRTYLDGMSEGAIARREQMRQAAQRIATLA